MTYQELEGLINKEIHRWRKKEYIDINNKISLDEGVL